ncbi:MAG: hypothetical protein KatS3mg087_1179 [Patescibacteria group bacterium]|nr:MAG: hypothetical protein KatS3mg087_1179 [Patescibacteria group bacterium]
MDNVAIKLVENSVLATILFFILWAAWKYISAREDFHSKQLDKRLRRIEIKITALLELLILHDMTVTGINPSTDIKSSDPEIVRITAERARKSYDIIKELKEELSRNDTK